MLDFLTHSDCHEGKFALGIGNDKVTGSGEWAVGCVSHSRNPVI